MLVYFCGEKIVYTTIGEATGIIVTGQRVIHAVTIP
jgi:hypothetical protein